jgi:hypothetical protein
MECTASHVFGQTGKKEFSIDNAKVSNQAWDTNLAAASGVCAAFMGGICCMVKLSFRDTFQSIGHQLVVVLLLSCHFLLLGALRLIIYRTSCRISSHWREGMHLFYPDILSNVFLAIQLPFWTRLGPPLMIPWSLLAATTVTCWCGRCAYSPEV